MSHIILDHLKGIKYNTECPPFHNLHAIDDLTTGIFFLANKVREEEINLYRKHHGRPPTLMALGGFDNQDLISCCFQWFVLSVINYLRLVGLVDILNQKNWFLENVIEGNNRNLVTEHCKAYVQGVVPQLIRWRNKIAAHFAATAPYNDDGFGTMSFSLINPVTYYAPYFEVGRLKYNIQGNEDFPTWQLSKLYEELASRFWIDKKLPEIN